MEVRIIRSRKRKKTISAREVDGIMRLYLPMGIAREEEEKYVQWAKKRFESLKRKRELKDKNADGDLEQRAREMNKKYFGGRLSWERVCYSTEQNTNMFGNCDRRSGIIRMSDRLRKMPRFVHDYVLVHELAHLIVPGHGADFRKLVDKYAKTERAMGYLMAMGMMD